MNDQIDALLDRLVPAFDNETGNWDDVLGRARVTKPKRRRPLLLVAAAAALLLVAVLVGTPWRGRANSLERASAAIAGPSTRQMLAEDVTVGVVTPSGKHFSRRLRVWVSGAAPHDFRVLIDPAAGQGATEIGGHLGGAQGLSMSGAYLVPATIGFPFSEPDLDPTAFIRKELAAGRAHVAGATTISGRKVIEIDASSRLYGKTVARARYFVDARTYAPLRLVVTAAAPNAQPGVLPLSSVVSFPYGGFAGSGDFVYRYDFARFERLPATAANGRLTNIEAMHPKAKVV